ARQLRDPRARAMLKELVACALDSSTMITDPDATQWRGELGLCQDWHSAPPSQQCQEIVTACVTARVNALKESIPISLRSESAPLSSPRPRVRTDVRFRQGRPGDDPAEGLLIGSFSR